MATVLNIFDNYYATERKRKLKETKGVPGFLDSNGAPDPSYWLMLMKVCEARHAEIAARMWQDPKVWYSSVIADSEPPQSAYRSLGSEGFGGAFDLDLLQMSLGGGGGGGVPSTGVTYHETLPYYDKQYRTYDGHYKYRKDLTTYPTEEEYRLWQVRDIALQTEMARIKAMHASALHAIMQHYGKNLTTDSDRVWRQYEEPEDGRY